ncbi:hypothetical protein D4764_13G0011900 [Takifugu flavidus]|uniref:Reverse transcriptase domain-containing protein n=1 Tax=Takifugu flavidus TaxID=433684 RepID=A0A5C6PD11_9TELE|nr:hypothetical protein D4764_13G0011900 [Takifugu flavidus]
MNYVITYCEWHLLRLLSLCICPSIHPSIHPSIPPSVYPSIHLSIHPSNPSNFLTNRPQHVRPVHGSNSMIKFADDTTVIGLISNNDETAYRAEVERLTTWCADNNLLLNTSKTK